MGQIGVWLLRFCLLLLSLERIDISGNPLFRPFVYFRSPPTRSLAPQLFLHHGHHGDLFRPSVGDLSRGFSPKRGPVYRVFVARNETSTCTYLRARRSGRSACRQTSRVIDITTSSETRQRTGIEQEVHKSWLYMPRMGCSAGGDRRGWD